MILVRRRQSLSLVETHVRSCGDSHQTWWRQTLGQAVAVIKLGGGTRWVRRRHTSSLVEASVKFDGGRTMVIVIIRRFDSVVLFGCRLFFGRCPLLCFRFVSLCFCSVLLYFCFVPLYFCSMLLCFVFANLLWFSFVVLIVEICLLPIFLFVFLAIS